MFLVKHSLTKFVRSTSTMLFASRYHNIAEFTKPSGKTIHHWSENVIILTIFSTLAALAVVKMTSGAIDQTDLIKMVFPSQWYIPLQWRHMNDTVSQSPATRLFVQKPAQANNAWNIKSPKCWLALIQSIPLTKDQLCCLWHWHCKAIGIGITDQPTHDIGPEWHWFYMCGSLIFKERPVVYGLMCPRGNVPCLTFHLGDFVWSHRLEENLAVWFVSCFGWKTQLT